MFRFHRDAPARPIREILAGALALGLALGVQAVSVADASAARHTTVLVSTSRSALGSYLETAQGFTLYTFGLDTGNKSACTGACANAWPPLLVPKGAKLSKLVHGVQPSKLGEIRRSNGRFQLTFEGKPLYRFGGDKSAGQMNGQGFENLWFVALVTPVPVTPVPATAAPAATPTPQASSTGPSSGSSGSPTPPPPPTTQPPPPTTTQPPPYTGGGGYGY